MTRPESITCAEAQAWLSSADAPRVVDVRTPAEFAGERLAGAVNIPLDLVETKPAEVAALIEGEALFVCRSDARATRALQLLAPHIGGRGHVLRGGMAGWSERKMPVTKGGSGVWAMDRQVRATAGGIVLTSLLASLVAPRAKWVAGGIGAGLLYSGVSDSCAMAKGLSKMPWNQRSGEPTIESVKSKINSSQKEN